MAQHQNAVGGRKAHHDFMVYLLFMMCGFEHSIANMSIIGVGLLHPLTADATISVNLIT